MEPLHIATVGGHSLRFFRTPVDDGRPDLPWHAVDDLGHCLGLNRAGRRIHQRVYREIRDWKQIVRTVATADGPVTIAPHCMAMATVGGLIDTGRAPASAEHEYVNACAEAAMKFGIGPFPSPQALTEWMNAAGNRWGEYGHRFSVADLNPFMVRVSQQGEPLQTTEVTVTDEDQREYLLTEGQTLFLTICACGDEKMTNDTVKDICHDMVKVIMAWRRGKLLPKWEVPELGKLCKDFETPDWPPKEK